MLNARLTSYSICGRNKYGWFASGTSKPESYKIAARKLLVYSPEIPAGIQAAKTNTIHAEIELDTAPVIVTNHQRTH